MLILCSLVALIQPCQALQRTGTILPREQFDMAMQFDAGDYNLQLNERLSKKNINMHEPLQDECSSCLNFAPVSKHFRIGEAANPGPTHDQDLLCIRTFNPAQLLGNEDVIRSWPKGVWTAAETRHTQAAMAVTRSRLKKHDINVHF